MLEILLDSETKDKLTKIKRKSSLDDFRSFLVQEFAFTFDHISLLRKHILKLPSRSLISKDKIMIFNCGKVWKEWNGWIKVVLETRFLKFKAISSKFKFVLPVLWSLHFYSIESAESFQNFCRIMFFFYLSLFQ